MCLYHLLLRPALLLAVELWSTSAVITVHVALQRNCFPSQQQMGSKFAAKQYRLCSPCFVHDSMLNAS